MKLYLPLLLSSAFLFTIPQAQECDNLDSNTPCRCFKGKFACLWHRHCSWYKPHCIDSQTPTEFPSYEPTPDPTKQPTPFSRIECGDHVDNTWNHDNITWILNIASDTQYIDINACNSNYNTVLSIYASSGLERAIITSDNDCVISIDHGLSAGTYYLLLSAKDMSVDGEYDLIINCEYKALEIENELEGNNECDSDCDAFIVRMMYYDSLSAYDTDNAYSIDDMASVICYTYVIERMFNDGVCREGVDGIVLGLCDDDIDVVDDIDRLIVSQIGGDLYKGYNSSGIDGISGIKMDIYVDDAPIEFTLCMNGINNNGILSDTVEFTRGLKKTYLCRNEGNDGLPCLSHKLSGEISILSRILWVVLFIVLSVMVIVSSLYHFITNKNRLKLKPWRMSDIDWSEIKVSDTMTETDEPKTEKDPLDPSDDISDLSANETDQINELKETMDDLNKKFINEKNNTAERAIQHIRSYRNSVCSTLSENDETTILPIYDDYDINGDSDAYWFNADVYSNNET